jgi:hypothetical protein
MRTAAKHSGLLAWNPAKAGDVPGELPFAATWREFFVCVRRIYLADLQYSQNS